MRLIIVRHGETVDNMNRICQGHTPGKLSEKGIYQAKRLGKRFQNLKIDEVYSSDLARAVDTAKEILVYHQHLKIRTDKRIRERYYGSLEGKPYPENWEFVSDDIESNEALCTRVENFLNDIYSKNKTILIVCHGGTKKAFLSIITHLPKSSFREIQFFENTSVSEFILEENQNHKIVRLNCTQHLD